MEDVEAEVFKKKCYEAYQLDWMISHGHGLWEFGDFIEQKLEEEAEEAPISNMDDANVAYCNAREAFEEEGFSGSMFVCMEEFLGAEFLDRHYMLHLLNLMPNKEEVKSKWQKITGKILPCEVEVETSAGTLKACENPDPGQPGIVIMLSPKGHDVEIDTAFVSVYQDPDYSTADGETPDDVVVMTYGDPYTEDYTHKEIIRGKDVEKVC